MSADSFILLAVFSRCPQPKPKARQNGQGPFIGKNRIFIKVPLVGTIHLCLKMPEKIQKTRIRSSWTEKRSKNHKESPNSKFIIFHQLLEVFSAKDDQILFQTFLFRHLETKLQSNHKGYINFHFLPIKGHGHFDPVFVLRPQSVSE